MRKLMLLAAMLAMVLVAAAPALAQQNPVAVVDQDQAASIVQECNTLVTVVGDAQGGDAVGGDQTANLNQLQNQEAALQAELKAAQANLAALENAQGQYSEADLIAAQENVAAIEQELTQVQEQIASIEQGQVVQGGDAAVTIGDVSVTGAECKAIINQVAQGEAKAVAVAEVVELVDVVDAADVVGVDDDADGVVDEADEVVVAPEDADDVAVLPDTGGASLFTLGAGALLVGGGLLARRIFR